MKIYAHKSTFTCMSIERLFKIAEGWKQSKCPLVKGWINTMWYVSMQ